jgi:hypothetical protein
VKPGNFCAVIAAASLVTGTAGVAAVAVASPALAVTCPGGSVAWYTESDGSGNGIAMNADDFGTGSDTCFTYGAGGQMTVTQASATKTTDPTSYPNDSWGCGTSYCTPGWTSEPWWTPTFQISGSLNTSGVASGSIYDLLTDVFLTSTTRSFSSPNVEIEIVADGYPSYSAIGDCVSTSCGATVVWVAGTSWWLSERTAPGGWPDYFFVRSRMTTSVRNLPIQSFLEEASSSGVGPGLGSYDLGYVGFGTEFWDNGLGMAITSVRSANLP